MPFHKTAGDYPYLFSRVAGQSHWPSLQTKPPNMIGLLPSFGANKPAGWTYGQSPARNPWTKAEFGCIISLEKTAVDDTEAAESNKGSP
jgi:hypothetical protein